MKNGGMSRRDVLLDRQAIDERRRRIGAEQIAARVGVRERRLHRHDRIQQRDEVRTRADRIDRRAGPPFGGVEPRRGGRREVAAGRCAEQADAIRLARRIRRRAIAPTRIARSTSCSGAGWPYSDSRYFNAKTVTPSGESGSERLRPPRCPSRGASNRRRHRQSPPCRRTFPARRIVRERGVMHVDDATIDNALGACIRLRALAHLPARAR